MPLVAFAGLLALRVAAAEQTRLEQETLARARAIATDIDRDLTGLQATLQTLATTDVLDERDFERFQRRAQEVGGFLGVEVVLGDLDGQQIVNTRQPWGTALPRTPLATDRQVRETRLPAVSNLFLDAIDHRPLYALTAPVLHAGTAAVSPEGTAPASQAGGEVDYLLSFNIPAGRLRPIIAQPPDSDWVVGVGDRAGVYLARSARHAEFAGRPGLPGFLAAATGQEGVFQGVGANGVPVLAGYARSSIAGWLVAANIPRAVVAAPVRRSLQAMAALGALALALSLALAFSFGRRFTESLHALVGRAAALAQGEPVAPLASPLREADEVGAALAAAATELAARKTARDMAAAALRQSEARQRLVLQSATDYAIVTCGLDGRITGWSAGAQNVLGWEPAEAIGLHMRIVFIPEDQASGRAEAEMRLALAEGRGGDDGWRVRKDGTRFWASGEIQPLRDEAGRAIGFLKIHRDRTRERAASLALQALNDTLEERVAARTAELREANSRLVAEMTRREDSEGQLRQMQKMEAVGQLTGGIAHDFNNMLAVVIGSLSLLRRRLARGDRDIGRFVDAATEGATRAATLTQRMLAFSRQQPLAPEPLDANALVSGMAELLHRSLGEEVRLETVLADDPWRTHADRSQLENAVLNLAVNGRDAMEGGGRLTIETANRELDAAYAAGDPGLVAGPYVMIAVTDTGAGMTPAVAAKAFEPFFTTKPVGRGTGLGLSQVYGFVKQSGGYLEIQSAPGQGTTVKVYLPRFLGGAEAAGRRAVTVPQDLPLGRRQEVILVVEDEERVRQFTVEALTELGYTVVHAENATAALRQLDGCPEIGLLFTDIVMPDVNGRKLADEAVRRKPGLKVLYTTGYTRDAVVDNGVLDAGVNLIAKPFTLEQVAMRVRTVLETPLG